ncbi:MAG: lpg1639 family Dot/Icm T4SS effector [Ruegeria sp.]
MSFDLMTYQPRGDKKNSDFFHEYLPKIYQRRQASGIAEQVGQMAAVSLQVEPGAIFDTLVELYVMTPYRHAATYLGATHRFSVLHAHRDFPALILMAPLSAGFEDYISRLNRMYPLARATPQTRYVGEVFAARDLHDLRRTLEDQNIRFDYAGDTENPFYTLDGMLFTTPSDFTCNRVGYSVLDFNDPDSLGLGDRLILSAAEQDRLARAAEFGTDSGIAPLMLGLDHLATRVLAGEREDAILEFLTMVPYYFWGAYNIAEMNSSTNVNRHPGVDDDKKSPAKVFTANNTPSFVNSFAKLPMPTEDFVRNFGRRLHHMAVEIRDGDHAGGEKNVDFVVNTLKEKGVPFLAHVVGECKDDPNLKQIFSKHSKHTLLITEYIERCHHYDGFFTKDNVAALTAAAGQDEQYRHGNVFD